MMVSILIHIGLGLVLAFLFAVLATLKSRSGRLISRVTQYRRAFVYMQNILLAVVTFITLVVVVKFLRNYEPRSWVNAVLFVSTWVLGGFGARRFLKTLSR
jgi:hypothetical protein